MSSVVHQQVLRFTGETFEWQKSGVNSDCTAGESPVRVQIVRAAGGRWREEGARQRLAPALRPVS